MKLATFVSPLLFALVVGAAQAQTSTWTKLSPTTSPLARFGHVAGYDVARDRVIVFGGIGIVNNKRVGFGDTWTFDGSTWSNVTPNGKPSPGSRWNTAGTYDPVRRVFVIFGGGGHGSEGSYSDTWEWNGIGWTVAKPASSPPKREGHRMFFDGKLKKVILFGGWFSSTKYGDTWSWDGKNWVQLKPKVSPSLRQAMGMAYDTQRQCGVLFGGVDQVKNSNADDTWEWDGAVWTKKTVLGPSKRASPGMAFDSVDSRMILFGGSNAGALGETWAFDGKSWKRLALSGASPSRRYTPGLVYDSKRARTILFGGASSPTSFFADTWSLPSNTQASLEAFGKGCASTIVLPTISGTLLKLGQTFTLDIKGFLPKPQFGQLIFGASNTRWGLIELPFNLAIVQMNNCHLLVSLDNSSLIATDAQGRFKTTLKVPSTRSLLGVQVYGQAWAPDPKANPLGVAMTNGIKAVIGL